MGFGYPHLLVLVLPFADLRTHNAYYQFKENLKPVNGSKVRKMTNIYDISKLSGTSISTVSRVLNNNTSVSEEKRNKVLDAIDKLGYSPNHFAQNLARNASNTIGVLVNNLKDVTTSQYLAALEAVFVKNNKLMVVSIGQEGDINEPSRVRYLLENRCNGLILDAQTGFDSYQDLIASNQIPVVSINPPEGQTYGGNIYDQSFLAPLIATQYLLTLDHKSLVYVSDEPLHGENPHGFDIVNEMVQETQNCCGQMRCFYSKEVGASGENGLEHFLNSNMYFTAVIASSDKVALGIANAARARGLRIPEDFSLISCENSLSQLNHQPPITAVGRDAKQLGTSAAEMLIELSEKEDKNHVLDAQQKFMIPKVFERGSVLHVYRYAQSLAAR